jgi:hypothetical protein
MSDNKITLQGDDKDINDDLNGECFIAGAEGEPEVLIRNNLIRFPSNSPAASENQKYGLIAFTSEQMNAFLLINTLFAIVSGRTHEQAAKVAYIRFLAARNGLVSPNFSTAINNVRYNHAVFDKADVSAIISNDTEQAQTAVKAINETLSSEFRKNTRKCFTNLVCCVAYIFRVRGHHYMDDFQERYQSLWARCLYKPDELPVEWELVATDALHAIMPAMLDEFWGICVNEARCAGTLIKRYDSAPAGAAGVVALDRGLSDVIMLFPGIVEKVPEAHAEFRSVLGSVSNNRWGGSINARFYGAARIRVDEAKIGALASVVMGIYEHLAPNSKLRDSMALKRLAEIAPATGGAIGIAARRAAQDERMNLIAYTAAVPTEEVD